MADPLQREDVRFAAGDESLLRFLETDRRQEERMAHVSVPFPIRDESFPAKYGTAEPRAWHVELRARCAELGAWGIEL